MSTHNNCTVNTGNVKTSSSYTFDEALALCGTGKFHYLLSAICGLSVVTFLAISASVGTYVMFTKCDMDMTVYEQGLLASGAFIGILLSSYVWGFLSETWSRIKVIQISMIGTVILGIISAFSYTTWMLIVLRILVGAFLSASQISIFSYLGEFHSSRTKGKAVISATASLSLSRMFLATLAISILPVKFDWQLYGKPLSSWRLLEISCAIPGAIASVALLFMPESPKYLFTKDEYESVLTTLKTIYSINTGKRKDEFPVEKFSDSKMCGNSKETENIDKSTVARMWDQTIPIFGKKHVGVTLNLLVHLFVIQLVVQGLIMWLPEIINTILKHTDDQMTMCEIMRYEIDVTANLTGRSTGNLGCATYVDTNTYVALIIMTIVYTFISLFMGCLSRIIRKRNFLVFWLVVSGCCGIALVFSRNVYISLFLFLGFLAAIVCTGIILAICFDYYPTNICVLAAGMVMTSGRLGSMIASILFGVMVNYQCNALFYGLGSLVCALAFLSLCLPKNAAEEKH